MGRRSVTGGVIPLGRYRIQFDFTVDGVRYRPTLKWTPNETNLRRARDRLARIKARIDAGTFTFTEEFPAYRFRHTLRMPLRARTCSDVFDAFLGHERARVARGDLAPVTLTVRETVFWQHSEGSGATSAFDLERLLAERFLLRLTGSATLTQNTQGVRWFSSETLYQNLGASRALAYQLGASGESNLEVPLSDYGFRLIYRRSVLRDWLFLELRTSITWPRDTLLERRESNLGVGAGLELQFGERTRR
jgi:Arm DNA-binding domain